MQSNEYYHYKYLELNGFQRRKCSKCGSFFWTTDSDRKTCGDSPCDSYGFIGNPPVTSSFDVKKMRETFISFFSDTHKRIEPYPVVPRWRDDVLLVNASIYDFQPHVTSGLADPPGNPLVLSQPSIRMVDVDNVGKTGRHTTSFEMMCHDAFNRPNRKIYWKDETVEYCNEFLTKKLGITPDLISYKENPWSGGGNGGEALEVLVLGLEVATLVFMDMKLDSNGETVIDGERYSKMDQMIVDTGYGLERLSWLTTGKESIYESIFGETLEFIYGKIKIEKPDSYLISLLAQISSADPGLSETELLNRVADQYHKRGTDVQDSMKKLSVYKNASIISDHTRTILLLLNDKVVPSNVKVGYVLRMLIRRTLRSMKTIGLKCGIEELVDIQEKKFREIVKNYDRSFGLNMLTRETSKYNEILHSGKQIVSSLIEKSGNIDEATLLRLYDSNGLDPETVSEIYEEKTGKHLEVPEDFHSRVISLHSTIERKEERIDYPEIETRPLYYDDIGIKDFTGVVLYSKNGRVILNQTAFYPEGGGQPPDHGYLDRGQKRFNVSYVQKFGKTIVHHVDGNPEVKSRVQGHIDYERRWQLMIHHSATHLLLAVTREVLGSHIWQTGVQKGIDSSRIDVVHFDRITEQEIARIEQRCLEVIEQNRKITVRNMDWNLALEKFGFTLFQGGVPLDNKIRVVQIEDIDAEGCGGTHLHSTGPIGMIKILSAESLQEGIQRIVFAAGPALLKYVQGIHGIVSYSRSVLKTDNKGIQEAILNLVNENKDIHKQIGKDEKKRIQEIMDQVKKLDVGNHEIGIFSHELEGNESKKLVKAVTSKGYELAFINNRLEGTTSIVSSGTLDASEIAAKIAKLVEANVLSGGKKFCKVDKSIEIDENLLRQVLV